jgi:hypothetical protein
MKMRLIALLAVTALSATALAVPASASPGVGVFGGVLETSYLGLPVVHGLTRTGTWRLISTGGPSTESGYLDASGLLGPVSPTPVGASCGFSQGHSGSGTFYTNTVSNLGWRSSAGEVLPVTGDWSDASGSGDVVALVYTYSVYGPCLWNSGWYFQVIGVAALTPVNVLP